MGRFREHLQHWRICVIAFTFLIEGAVLVEQATQ